CGVGLLVMYMVVSWLSTAVVVVFIALLVVSPIVFVALRI
ncbi:hypothetical protein, partial [uncultured Gammaproteobacteria bacterium]